MINCSLFPSILKPLNPRNQSKPKFQIGDYVELQGEDENGIKFWERGIIKGVIGPGWHWNATKDEWLYYYEIAETSYSFDFKGAPGEGFESELRLISRRSVTRIFQYRP